MVNIVLCGPDDTRNQEMVVELRERCRKKVKDHRCILHVNRKVLTSRGIGQRKDFRCNELYYEQVLTDLVLKQSAAENSDPSVDFITDSCLVNTLAYANICLDGQDAVERIVQCDVSIKESLDRYKSSLVVLLGPRQIPYDDGMWLILKEIDWAHLLQVYKDLLNEFKIPHVDLSSDNISEACAVLHVALSGTIQLETSNLMFYQHIAKAEKNGSGNAPEGSNTQTQCFSFFRKAPARPNRIFIRTIKILEHRYEQEWTEFPKDQTNRFVKRHGQGKLICVQFNINVRSTHVQKMLLNGISVNGILYTFLGCSSSGLKDRKCYMWEGTEEEVKDILQSNGDFEALKTVSKRMARIGLLFSVVIQTPVKLETDHVVKIDDIKVCGHNFSDGCGLIGQKVARELFHHVKDKGHADDYLPSIYQVRYQGYKGVLAIDVELAESKIAVRPSMEKFYTDQHPYVGVCQYSRAYTFGHLNKQFIQLLSGLGVPDEKFLDKQNYYFRMIETMLTQSDMAVMCLQWRNNFEHAQHIVSVGGLENANCDVIQGLKKLQQDLITKLNKLSILVPKSRTIFGICDTTGSLDYGECFLRLTVAGKPMTIRGQVVICKNPCYLLGDVRVLTALDDTDKPNLAKLNHLRDCVVFPSKGKRPHADEIAGSDLDGDQYFVTWDEDLIPRRVRPPYDYPPAKPAPQAVITHKSVIAYFSKQNETQKLIARVHKFYNIWADLKNVTSTQCELLGQLFSRVIDSGKSGEEVDIPKGLHPPSDKEDSKHMYIWEAMEKNAKEFESRLKRDKMEKDNEKSCLEDISSDFVYDLVSKTYTNITEYEKFRFCWSYSMFILRDSDLATEAVMEQYIDNINFSKMSVEERKVVIEKGVPRKYVMNALNKSGILTEDDLKHFQMDCAWNTWNEYLILPHEEFDWSHLYKSLTTNEFVLVVLEMPDSVIIELQFLGKLTKGIEQTVMPGTISALFYSKHFGYKYRYILGPEYVLDLTEDTLQLYRESKKNLTFVWLKATDRKITKRRWNKRVCDEVVNSVSVDLQRFNRKILAENKKHPLVNKTPFVKMEIYAQNSGASTEFPYWDSYDVNDILPIQEVTETEIEDQGIFSVDFDQLFPNESFKGSFESDDEFLDALSQAEENPHLFKSVIETGNGRCFPKDTVTKFTSLLKHMTEMISPLPLPEKLKTLLVEILTSLTEILQQPSCVLKMVSYLNRLGLADITKQLVQKCYTECTLTADCLFSVIGDWESLWYIDSKSARLFLDRVFAAVNKSAEQDAENRSILLRRTYIHRLGILHALAFFQEIDNIQATLNHTNHQSKLKESQTSVWFLKVDISMEQTSDTVSFYRTCALEMDVRITQGQYVAITRQSDPGAVCCIGQVQVLRLAPFSFTVKVDGKVPQSVQQAVGCQGVIYFRADLIGNIVTYMRVTSALKTCNEKKCDCSIVDVISNTASPQCAAVKVDEDDSSVERTCSDSLSMTTQYEINSEDLNERQQEAVSASLQRQLCLIQGPPGTGKTKVACHIVKQIHLMKRYTGILVVGETNVAVDNLARRLRNDLLIVRVGSGEGIASDLYDISLEGQVKLLADKEGKRTKVRDEHGDLHRNTRLIKRVLAAADVVLATCSGAGDSTLESYKFEFVLVDEATLTMETTLFCSLAHGVKHLVLIGDHKQLGPVITDTGSQEADSNLPCVSELSQTLFHRLFEMDTIPSCFLDTQHRMHPEIMKFPSQEFYDDRLRAADSVKSRLGIIFPWPQMQPFKPVCFINVESRETRRGTSYCNLKEIDVVKKVIDVLLTVDEEGYREHRIGVNHIGVLTLYQAQVAEMKSKIKAGVAISSVDAFQGQERDVIVVSTVRCNDRQSVGFSGDPERINVLLTRAKRGLIVVGNSNTLRGSEIWTRWLMQAPTLIESEIKPLRPIKEEKKKKYRD